MKQLCEKLQNEFRDIVICTVSPILPCVQIVPTLERDFFSQSDILMIIQYCQAHNLCFYFDCGRGRIVVYQSPVLDLINKNK